MQGLGSMYYIICTDEAKDWWQLRKTDDHQVVACGVGKDFILRALQGQAKKYTSTLQLKGEWSNLEYTKPLRKEVLEKRRLEYEVVKDISDIEVNRILKTTGTKPTLRRRRDITTLSPSLEVTKQVEEEVSPNINPSIRRRRLVRK